MRKEIVLSLLVASLTTGLQAGGDIGGITSFENNDNIVADKAAVEVKAPVVKVEAKKIEPKVEESHGGFYTVVKGLSILGENADSGYGAGIDLGYNFNDSFGVELGGTFAKNELDTATSPEASYKTVNLSLVYNIKATDSLGLFAKAGYMTEQMKVNATNYDESEAGAVFGAGIDYEMSESTALVAEYEMSTIDEDDSSRGDAISLGLKYNF